MSRFRGGVIGLTLATVLGVANGIVVFRPAFEEQAKEKQTKQWEGQDDASPAPKSPPTAKLGPSNVQASTIQDRGQNKGHSTSNLDIQSPNAPSQNIGNTAQPEANSSTPTQSSGIGRWLPWVSSSSIQREEPKKLTDIPPK